jgi:hypothetical protein
MKLAGIGVVGLVVIGVAGYFIYKKMKDKSNDNLLASSGITVPAGDSASSYLEPMKSGRATYYNPYSYNARYALMSSISPAFMHKGYFSAPQHSIGQHNVMPAFSFDRDDEQ